jgi:hypothetical protein
MIHWNDTAMRYLFDQVEEDQWNVFRIACGGWVFETHMDNFCMRLSRDGDITSTDLEKLCYFIYHRWNYMSGEFLFTMIRNLHRRLGGQYCGVLFIYFLVTECLSISNIRQAEKFLVLFLRMVLGECLCIPYSTFSEIGNFLGMYTTMLEAKALILSIEYEGLTIPDDRISDAALLCSKNSMNAWILVGGRRYVSLVLSLSSKSLLP